MYCITLSILHGSDHSLEKQLPWLNLGYNEALQRTVFLAYWKMVAPAATTHAGRLEEKAMGLH